MKSREFLERILACPQTGLPLEFVDRRTVATATGIKYRVKHGVPIVRVGDGSVDVKRRNHKSNPVPTDHANEMLACAGLVLNVGAGSSEVTGENIVQLEYSIFGSTDVVGDAHQLPFLPEMFDLVVAFNTFEHLREPFVAAEEIRRVLRPGGKVIIHTAFLQPLHEEPFHFFNATEYGIQEWFRGFTNFQCTVSPNFAPHYGMGWLAFEVLQAAQQHLGAREREILQKLTLGDLADFWAARREAPSNPAFQLFQNLPYEVKRRTAAGFEAQARKPA